MLNDARKPPHACLPEDILAQYRSEADGLSSEEAKVRLAAQGPNRLPAPPRRHPFLRLLAQFNNALIYMLLGSAGITALLQHWIDTGVILAVVLINALLGFIQEGRAEQAMEAVRRMLAPMATVLRNGQRQAVSAVELVTGDIVLLEAGDRVPADLRLLNCHSLRMQEAILTGESVAVGKSSSAVDAEAALGDRSCMAYSGTLVSSGQGRGLVVATGSETEIGRISGLLSSVEPLVTPLLRQISEFARWLTLLILVISALVLLFGYFIHHHPFADLFMAVVALAVAAIPEGLPAVLTITLAIGVQAMAKHHAIVRRLPAIETIGAVSVICTDKTGTLTSNEMMVTTLMTDLHHYRLTGSGYAPEGHLQQDDAIIEPHADAWLEPIAAVISLCNDACLHKLDGRWNIEGDPMEGALLVLARKLGRNDDALRRSWPRIDAIPFDASHRYMATLNHDHRQHACIYVKGAPEVLLELCSGQWHPDGPARLDREHWRQRYEAIAAEGQRVLALAMKPVSHERTALAFDDLEDGLLLLGLVGLIDPTRPEAISAVAQCRQAGVSVKMITGDHAGTATAIARQAGLEKPETVLTGADLDQLSDGELMVAIKTTNVFARTSPEHKLRLVMALQANSMIVAMTGDGVNDAPALKRADIGIAMGRSGSEAAKEAADLVLADDNFATIVAAVREGRRVYDNLRKVIGWTLPTSSGEALTVIIALLLGTTLPVTPVQILWVNLITAITLGLALAFEPLEARTMQRPPRRRKEPLLTGTLAWHIVLVSSLFPCGVYGIFSYALDQGYSIELARTMAINTLVVMEIFHLFFMRNFYTTSLTPRAIAGTPIVWLTVVLVTLGQFAVTYLPLLQRLFGTEAVPFTDGLVIIGIGAASFVIIELEKQLRLRWAQLRSPK
ncbi:cation-transporting P-type ATPase [Halomonas binhaiensis]|uniref:Cation-transporting P-type ATPase n=1 Tax=Halomonas binhaiensis TaxID=2562282 RepID=A0A5C1NAV3_9GAMM|nr:cation-transporting P-type ATPase [Halomonas binhaiensis]QEM80274.1 cation-transporting P-type ATPase [Halomonas binhaiensis]